MQASPTEYVDAFQLLQTTVAELLERGKSTRNPGLKAQLQRRTAGEFDERRLGFQSFGEFVEAAAAAGWVERVWDEDGFPALRLPEVESGTETAPTAPRRPIMERNSGGGGRIRPDVWHAFVNWQEDVRRVWDLEQGRVQFLPAEPGTETANRARLRLEIKTTPARFVEIAPITMEEQLEWVHEFVDELRNHPLAAPLRASLDQPRPLGMFSRVIRADPALASDWTTQRFERVSAHVARWFTEHGLADELAARHVGTADTDVLATRQVPDSATADRLRRALHDAIDRMPAEDLARLQIPVGYLSGALR